jgi:hypothetical protein
MRSLGELRLKPYPTLVVLSWPTDRRLFTQSCCAEADRLLVVDPSTRTVVARAPLTFDSNGTVPVSDAIAYLASPSNRIGPAAVVLIDVAGNSRLFAPFSRISAGRHWHKVRGVQVLEIRQPGFTVDPDRRIAYVVASSTVVAELDLRTGAVAYHAIAAASAWRLAQTEKEFNGTTRYARWLGDGRIAVAGVRYASGTLRKDSRPATSKPGGVALLDTHTWRMQMLDRNANGFVADGTHLLALEARAVKVHDGRGVAHDDSGHRLVVRAGLRRARLRLDPAVRDERRPGHARGRRDAPPPAALLDRLRLTSGAGPIRTSRLEPGPGARHG